MKELSKEEIITGEILKEDLRLAFIHEEQFSIAGEDLRLVLDLLEEAIPD